MTELVINREGESSLLIDFVNKCFVNSIFGCDVCNYSISYRFRRLQAGVAEASNRFHTSDCDV